MFQDDAPDVAPSTEFTYFKKRRQQKAKKASENNSNEQNLQTLIQSPVQMDSATAAAEHDVATKTSDKHVLNTTVPSRPDGSLHCISNVSAMLTGDIEGVSTESHVERPSLTIPVALGLLVVVTVVNIQFTFTAVI